MELITCRRGRVLVPITKLEKLIYFLLVFQFESLKLYSNRRFLRDSHFVLKLLFFH